jgi:iron complex transport system substrate-binding protein
MRICSFLPSATEILFALGLGDSVAGVTFECDFPPEARQKPVVVTTRMKQRFGPAAIDQEVSEFMARGESLYQVDEEKLAEIKPDLIITQDLCHVCAASPGDLASALTKLSPAPRVMTLSPHSLSDVWSDILAVGEATERTSEAHRLMAEIEQRISRIEKAAGSAGARPRVLCLEWLDPPFIAGHWVPEMARLAGGEDVLGKVGEPGFKSSWEAITAAKPEVFVVMPCGYHLEEVVREFRGLHFPPTLYDVPAFETGRIYAVDASSHFSRPGPRLAAGVEVLAQILHPDRISISFPQPAMQRL